MDLPQAWLEFASGERLLLSEICTIGRTAENTAIIASERVSRRHAVIRRTDHGGFELMDMGSSNGTYLNGQRLSRPAKLTDGCVLEIGLQKMVFRLSPIAVTSPAEAEVSREKCWLLVVEAALLGTRAPSQEAAGKTVEGWSERCQRVVQKYRGLVVRAANDGFLACWRAESGDSSASAVATVLRSLRAVQTQSEEFRFALHFGEVTLQRGASGEWKPTGPEVFFTLQLSRLVSAVDTAVLITERAGEQLRAVLPLRQVSVQEMGSYRGSQRFYALQQDCGSGSDRGGR